MLKKILLDKKYIIWYHIQNENDKTHASLFILKIFFPHLFLVAFTDNLYTILYAIICFQADYMASSII